LAYAKSLSKVITSLTIFLWFNDHFLQSTAQRNTSLPGQLDLKSFGLKSSIEVGIKFLLILLIDEKSLMDVSESYNHNSKERTTFSFNITITPTLPVTMDTV
jgi:hypothetical protein